MKKNSSSTRSASFNVRALVGFFFCFAGVLLALFAGRDASLRRPDAAAAQRPHDRYLPVPGSRPEAEAANLGRLEQFWNDRLTYPTGRFDPRWVRDAAVQHARMPRGIPAGIPPLLNPASPLALSTTSFTALGPQSERMTGCSGCFNYTMTEGRVNAIAVDPTTTVNGSIVAYLGAVGGGVWKTTNCCGPSTSWNVVTDDPLIATTAVDTLTINPNDHNTVYAGTGDLNFARFQWVARAFSNPPTRAPRGLSSEPTFSV